MQAETRALRFPIGRSPPTQRCPRENSQNSGRPRLDPGSDRYRIELIRIVQSFARKHGVFRTTSLMGNTPRPRYQPWINHGGCARTAHNFRESEDRFSEAWINRGNDAKSHRCACALLLMEPRADVVRHRAGSGSRSATLRRREAGRTPRLFDIAAGSYRGAAPDSPAAGVRSAAGRFAVPNVAVDAFARKHLGGGKTVL